MTEVKFMPNDDEKGMAMGKLYSMFPTKQYLEQIDICIPNEEVGMDLLNQMIAKLDEGTGMVKYLVELGEVWDIMAGMCGATIVISIVYIGLLKWITKPLLYISMLAILVGFILLGGWCWMKKDEYDQVT